MSELVTAPNQQTVLTTSGTYSGAIISGSLVIEGSGVGITLSGTTTGSGEITVTDGAELILGAASLTGGITISGSAYLQFTELFDGQVDLAGSDPSAAFSAGQPFISLIGLPFSAPAVDGTIALDNANVEPSILGFSTGDIISFVDPASSVIYTPSASGPGLLGTQPLGTLAVTENNGSIAEIILDGEFSDAQMFNPDYTQSNFAILSGSVTYVPTLPITISGAAAGQQVAQGTEIMPFENVIVADPNSASVDYVTVQLSQLTGVLADPNASTDGSTWNGATGVYSVAGAASSVTHDIDAIIFTPTVYTLAQGETVTTQLDISVTDSDGASSTNNTTSVMASNGFESVPCFANGTLIATLDGAIPVQQLVLGQEVLVACGGTMPIVWVGWRRVDCRRHSNPRKVWPVYVSVGAFGHRMPRRDLWLSPDHAVYVDGVLIPIKHLTNGTTIAQVQTSEVTYINIELERYAILFAEGLPAESYLDSGNRSAFANGGGSMQLHPEFGNWAWEAWGCAQLVVSGATFDAVKARVNAISASQAVVTTETYARVG